MARIAESVRSPAGYTGRRCYHPSSLHLHTELLMLEDDGWQLGDVSLDTTLAQLDYNCTLQLLDRCDHSS
jgi:hypothetical protein